MMNTGKILEEPILLVQEQPKARKYYTQGYTQILVVDIKMINQKN